MTNSQTTYIPKQHSATELIARIATAHERVERFSFYTTWNLVELLENHGARLAAGQSLSTTLNHVQYMDVGQGQVISVYTKESKQLAQELADVLAQVTADYEAEIAADTANAIEVMAVHMIAAKAAERAKVQADIDAAELAEAIAHSTQVMADAKSQAERLLAKQTAKLNKEV